jgi:hypothetical protein
MAAGLGFKTFTTGEVLTAGDVNGYLMQGVLVFASEAARNSAITSPQEGQFAYTKDNNSLWYYTGSAWAASGATGDIEGVTAGVGITGGGTSGTVTITNDMATTITASGDIVVGTGSGTYDNLPIGTTGQILTADTTVSPYKVKWATPAGGGKVLQVISKAVSTFQSINSTSYVDFTDFTLTITPSATTSKVLIFISVNGWDAQSQTLANPIDMVLRNGSNTVLNQPINWYAPVSNSNTATKAPPGLISQSYLDSPATTSAVTYKVSGKNASSPGNGFFMNNSATSSMTVMEIGV